VLPVRYALGPHAVQATTRQLSVEGAFIRSMSPPRAGVRVAIRIYFAEGKPEEFVALVENRERPAQETGGFWVRFDLVSAQAREKILVATGALPKLPKPGQTPSGGVAAVQAPGLRQTQPGMPAVKAPPRTPPLGMAAVQVAPDAVVPSPRQSYPGMQAVHAQAQAQRPAGRDRPDLRATTRHAAKLRTSFKTVAALREEVSHNISAGGMFIQTDEAPPLREVVLVSIALPGETEPLEVLAEVMHVVKPGQATAHLPAGVGVQFVQADDRFREKLDRYLAAHR
jgi:uncharacterized protein (TIGR02266 family)